MYKSLKLEVTAGISHILSHSRANIRYKTERDLTKTIIDRNKTWLQTKLVNHKKEIQTAKLINPINYIVLLAT